MELNNCTWKGVLWDERSVKPTISLKYIVTQLNSSGSTGLPSRNLSATDLESDILLIFTAAIVEYVSQTFGMLICLYVCVKAIYVKIRRCDKFANEKTLPHSSNHEHYQLYVIARLLTMIIFSCLFYLIKIGNDADPM